MAAALRASVVLTALVFASAAHAATTVQYPQDSDEFTAIGCSGTTCLLTTGSEATHGPAVLLMTNGTAGQVQPLAAGAGTMFAAACASADTCFAVGGNTENGQLVPVTGGSPQATQNLPDVDELHAIACPATNLCFAAGTATDPNSGTDIGAVVTIQNGEPTSTSFVDGANDVQDLSCASTSTCVGVASNSAGRNGYFVMGDGQPGDFQSLSTPEPALAGITGVECPRVDHCIGTGQTYAIPIDNGNAGRWVQVDGVQSLDEFACWSSSQCAGSSNDQPDLVFVSGALAGGNDVNLAGKMHNIDALACSPTACYAVGRSNTGPTFGAIATVPTSDLGPLANIPAAKLKCKVPKVVGLTLKKAKTKLKKANCRLGRVAKRSVTTKKSKGRVLTQKPKKGTFKKGKRIALVVGR